MGKLERPQLRKNGAIFKRFSIKRRFRKRENKRESERGKYDQCVNFDQNFNEISEMFHLVPEYEKPTLSSAF